MLTKNEVKVEKMFNVPAKDVFRALSEGRVFNCCGVDNSQLKIDFRVGGRYSGTFTNHGIMVTGKFLEIVQDRKIVFTWGDEGSSEGFPMTEVSMELFPDGEKTRLLLRHTGFTSQDEVDSHQGGWSGGINDLSNELSGGCVRIIRIYPVSRDTLYKACSNPAVFFGTVSDVARGIYDFKVGGSYCFPTKKGEVKGKYLEIVPGKKIAFTWLSGCDKPVGETRVTLTFDDEDDGKSSVELVHEFLPDAEQVKRHREGWEFVTSELRKQLK